MCVYNTVVNNIIMGARMISRITFIIYVHSQAIGKSSNSKIGASIFIQDKTHFFGPIHSQTNKNPYNSVPKYIFLFICFENLPL